MLITFDSLHVGVTWNDPCLQHAGPGRMRMHTLSHTHTTQLNPMESVDIFDETPTQAPMVSVKPETIGHDGSIIHNNLLPLHLNADPDAIGGQPPPRTMSIGQASAETLASIFGSAGLPAHIPGGGGGREGRRGETEDTASSNCAARTSPNGGGVERSSQEMGGQGGMMPLEGRSGASARGGGRIGQEYSALADSLNVHAAFGAPSMPVTEEGSQKHERHRRSRSHDERRSKRSQMTCADHASASFLPFPNAPVHWRLALCQQEPGASTGKDMSTHTRAHTHRHRHRHAHYLGKRGAERRCIVLGCKWGTGYTLDKSPNRVESTQAHSTHTTHLDRTFCKH